MDDSDVRAEFRPYRTHRVCECCGAYMPNELDDMRKHAEFHKLIDRLLELASGD